MVKWIVILSISCALTVGRAYAQACPSDEPWSCFGSIEMAISSADESGLMRTTRFRNGDMLGEMSSDNLGERKVLMLRPSVRLYYGISDKEITDGFPFYFFEYGFAYPAMALNAAFPLGPSSISKSISDMAVRFEGTEGLLSVEPKTATRIHYRLVLRDEKKMVMTGYWDTARPAPLADDYSVAKWKSCVLKTYATVGAARREIDECPSAVRQDRK